LFFFGVPHQGQNVKLHLERVKETSRGGPSAGKRVLPQLNAFSNFLSTQREDITYLFDSTYDFEIFTFYETIPVSPLEKVRIKQMFSQKGY
jgi:hypothetical protein